MEKYGLSKEMCRTIDTEMLFICGTTNIYSDYARSAEKKLGPQERRNRMVEKYHSVNFLSGCTIGSFSRRAQLHK
jgi:hypothetical protein